MKETFHMPMAELLTAAVGKELVQSLTGATCMCHTNPYAPPDSHQDLLCGWKCKSLTTSPNLSVFSGGKKPHKNCVTLT